MSSAISRSGRLGTVEGKGSWESYSKERLPGQGILQSLNEVTVVQLSPPMQTAFTLGRKKVLMHCNNRKFISDTICSVVYSAALNQSKYSWWHLSYVLFICPRDQRPNHLLYDREEQ